MNKPLISVIMITFNHAEYIHQAINGVLEQEGNFEIELIISDDASTDNTFQLLSEFCKSHVKGNLVKYTRHPENKGMMKNLMWAYSQCRGDFIALCEGDDYWIDSKKLQKQIEFLLENNDFILTYHPAMILKKNGELIKDFITENHFNCDVSNRLDLAIFGNYIHTPTVVFRNVNLEIPQYFEELNVGDFFLYLLITKYGNIKRLTDYSAVYRYQTGFFSSQKEEKIRNDFKKSLRVFYKNYTDFSIRLILFLRFNNSTLFKRKKFIKKSNLPKNLLEATNYLSIGEVFKSLKYFVMRYEFNRVFGKRFNLNKF